MVASHYPWESRAAVQKIYVIAKTEYFKTDTESAQNSVLNIVIPTVLVCFHFWFSN